MATIRTTDDQHARELAVSQKEHDKLERENKLMKMLMEICPPHKVTARYVHAGYATGVIGGYTVSIRTEETKIYKDGLVFSGTYPEAQAFLRERLGEKR